MPASRASAAAMASHTRDDRLPAFQMLVLCIVNLNEAVQGNVIWPFLPFAVQKWGAAPDGACAALR